MTSGEAKIASLTSERDKVSVVVAEQLVTLDSNKRTIRELEQQLAINKETSEQEIAELTEHLSVAKTELSVTREQLLGEVNKQLHEAEIYRNQVTLVEQKLESLQKEYTEAEEWLHHKEQEEHLTKVTKLSNDCQNKTAELG